MKLVFDLSKKNSDGVSKLVVTFTTRLSLIGMETPLHVNWGDGTPNSVYSNYGMSLVHTHTYATTGIYTVTLSNSKLEDFYMGMDIIGAEGDYSLVSVDLETDSTTLLNNITSLKFFNCVNLETLYGALPSSLTSISKMFFNCYSFTSNLSSWNVSNIIDMSEAFATCILFNSNLSNWNVANVDNMLGMFDNCHSFNYNLSNWNVSKVKNMSRMFNGCKLFTSDLSNWNVANVDNMSAMFSGCGLFTSDLSNWNVSKVRNMSGMFSGCGLFASDLSNWNVANVEDMSTMFVGCKLFISNLSNWNVSKVKNMSGIFFTCSSFTSNLSSWNVANVEDMSNMFYGCVVFNSDLSNWNVSKVKNMSGMFFVCKIFSTDLSNWDVANVEDMNTMFFGCELFTSDLSNWNVSKVKNMSRMFYYCKIFTSDLSNWDVSNVENMWIMFKYCTSIICDFSNWNVSKVKDMENMFEGVSISTNIYDNMLKKWSLLPLQKSVKFHGGDSKYTCDSEASNARNNILIGDPANTSTETPPFRWTITDGGCDIILKRYDVYVNISNTTSIGDGTISNPYSYTQWVEYVYNFNGWYDASDIYFHVKGYLDFNTNGLDAYSHLLNFRNVVPTDNRCVNVYILGWDISVNGSPIVRMNGSVESPIRIFEPLDVTHRNLLNINIKDFIINGSVGIQIDTGIDNLLSYKNVHFNVNKIYTKRNTGYTPIVVNTFRFQYYGCTFRTTELSFDFDYSIFVDCVFISEYLKLNASYLEMKNNITSINNFSNNINVMGGNLSKYIPPIYESSITSPPALSNFEDFISYYTNRELMYYKQFNIEESNSVVMRDIRIANGYNMGLFGDDRESYGAYSFTGEIIDDEDLTHMGHIGSFYFGSGVINFISNVDAVVVELISTGMSSINGSAYINTPTVDMIIPQKNWTIVSNRCLIDFVAKKRSDENYPKFCKSGKSGVYGVVPCNNCKTDNDVVEYNTQISGGNALVVDFSACATGVEDFESFKPIQYHWYFDYGNPLSATDSAITTTKPYATYTYCGTYLQEYNVKLCVDFENRGDK